MDSYKLPNKYIIYYLKYFFPSQKIGGNSVHGSGHCRGRAKRSGRPYPIQRLYVCRSLTVRGPKPELWSDGGLEAHAVIERTVGAATLGEFLHQDAERLHAGHIPLSGLLAPAAEGPVQRSSRHAIILGLFAALPEKGASSAAPIPRPRPVSSGPPRPPLP